MAVKRADYERPKQQYQLHEAQSGNFHQFVTR